MKLKLNSYVWVKYQPSGFPASFVKVKVVAKGTEFFIHEEAIESCTIDEFRYPIYYEDYGIEWFKTLKEIKQKYTIKKSFDNEYTEVKK